MEVEHKASLKQQKKHAEALVQSMAHDGGSSRSKTFKSMKESHKSAKEEVRGTTDAVKKPKNRGDIVQFSTPMEEDNIDKTAGAKRQLAGKRASSLERKTTPKKMKSTDEDTPLVLPATEYDRVITHGEEPSLDEAALDCKKFIQLFGYLYPFGVESVFSVNIKKMISAKAYQVTCPLDDAGVAFMKNYLI